MKHYNTLPLGQAQLRYELNEDGSHSPIVVPKAPDSHDPAFDAFGRARISSAFSLFASKQLYDAAPLFWDDQEVSGGGTNSTHSSNRASSTLAVSANTAGKRVRQTKRRFNYQPGKSQLIFMTAIMGEGQAGITRRLGYFDDNNGLFFQLSGTEVRVARRTKVTGNVQDISVKQVDWNIDTLDGSGDSGITLDLSKAQIFVIDFEWLGTGRVRFGFMVDGNLYYCHQILAANVLTSVYMSTPNLPLRYEISNDGTGGAATLEVICNAVISEGEQEYLGAILSASNANDYLVAASAGTLYACLGLRLKSTHFGANIFNLALSLMGASANDFFHWQLLLNPTVAGTFAYSDITNSACQKAIGVTANTVTGGNAYQFRLRGSTSQCRSSHSK